MAIDMKVFIKNRSEIPLEELEQYTPSAVGGLSPDGTPASSTGPANPRKPLVELLEKMGRDPFDCVYGYIDDNGDD